MTHFHDNISLSFIGLNNNFIAVAQSVEAQGYKPEGRGFDSR
jgi:hypothetical protein